MISQIFRYVVLVSISILLPCYGFGAPSLHDTKAFQIFAETGHRKVFSRSFKFLRDESVTEYRDGELVFMITGTDKGLLSANTGLSKVAVSHDRNSITFVETKPAGNQHILIINNEWVKDRGFRFSYTRHSKDIIKSGGEEIKETYRTHYKGIAVPLGYNQLKNGMQLPHYTGKLNKSNAFVMYERKGWYADYDYQKKGALIKKEKITKGLSQGEMQYVITDPNRGILSGNAGSAPVKVIRDDRSVTFIERAAGDNTFVMVVYDRWNPKERGFEYTYIRHWEYPRFDIVDYDGLSFNLLRSIVFGFAKQP